MSQIFLVEVLAYGSSSDTEKLEVYACKNFTKEVAGLDFKGQLLSKSQAVKIEKESFELESQEHLYVPWSRVIRIRNLSFSKKVKG